MIFLPILLQLKAIKTFLFKKAKGNIVYPVTIITRFAFLYCRINSVFRKIWMYMTWENYSLFVNAIDYAFVIKINIKISYHLFMVPSECLWVYVNVIRSSKCSQYQRKNIWRRQGRKEHHLYLRIVFIKIFNNYVYRDLILVNLL